MSSRERLEATFKGQTPDRLSVCHIGFSSDVASALLGHEAYVGGGIQQWREATALWQGPAAHQEFLERSFEDALKIALKCDNDIVRASYWRYSAVPSKRLDENTFLYAHGPESAWKVLRYDPPSEQCAISSYLPQAQLAPDDLESQVAAQEARLADYRPQDEDFAFELRAQHVLGAECPVRVGGVGIGIPTENVWLEAIALRPDLVARELDVQAEVGVRNVRFLAAHGFRYLFGGGDFGANSGPIYSPRVFHELVLPRLQRLTATCHECGCYYSFASDGDLWPVADDLFGCSGTDAYHEIDRRAGMDLLKLRARFPRLTLIGNISSHTVHTGTREEVVAETRACLEEARQAGGVVVGVSNYFVPGTPIANAEAVLETIRRYR